MALSATMLTGLSRFMFEFLKIVFLTPINQFVYVAWCGEGVTGIRKGSFGSHAQDMSKFLDVRT